ncbi:MAG: CHAT domain-containing protein [Humibacillus sp.]|nr:CHAT domain-containing protein [Humibacillus sp.]MDN5777352.1 CHAT domain-containing protein [Humibacillus sp.]
MSVSDRGPENTATNASEYAKDEPGRRRTRIGIGHGDLRFARSHVLAGHYAGSALCGGEAALDDLLEGRLRQASLLGVYPGPLETTQVFTDPETWATPPGAIIAGLGPLGTLSAAGLARSISHAALTAALAHLSNASPAPCNLVGQVHQLKISSLLAGSGPGGLSVRESMQALLTGIQRANDQLADTRVAAHIADVEIIELWQDRALLAVQVLRSFLRAGELRSSFTEEPRLRELPGRQRRLVFQEPPGWWQRVRVRSEPDGSLTFEASVRRAGAPTRTVCTQRTLVDRLVDSLVDSPAPDTSASRTLFELLMPNDLKVQSPDTDNLVLIVDQGSAHYPWELLDDLSQDQDGVPLGLRRGILRQLEGSSVRSQILAAVGDRVLIVGDTMSGSTPLPAAQHEARSVAAVLRTDKYTTKELIAATGTKVIQALFDGAYRIVHLAGHGVYRFPLADGTNTRVTGMVLGNGMYLTAGEIGQMRNIPELVFVNCCHLGATTARSSPMPPTTPATPAKATSAAATTPPGNTSPTTPGSTGPVPPTPTSTPPQPSAGTEEAPAGNYHRLAADFATELIETGVSAVVACGWAVDDEAASTFAQTFYRELINDATLGEAVAHARQTTWEQHPEVNTWGAYQCYGDPDFRLVHDRPNRQTNRHEKPSSIDQLRNEIENLTQSVDVTRNTTVGLSRLKALLADLDEDDLDDGSLQVLIARTYNRFGDFSKASDYFDRTLRAGGTALTVQDFELWIDQMVRAASAINGDADANAVDTAVTTITSSIERLRRLIVNPASLLLDDHASDTATVTPELLQAAANVDRVRRLAGAYKRLALVTCPGRSRTTPHSSGWSRTLEALNEMATCYDSARRAAEAAEQLRPGKGAHRKHSALANWLIAELVLQWHPVPGREPLPRDDAHALLAEALAAAREEAHLSPSFWTVAVLADLQVVEALYARTSHAKAEEAMETYGLAAKLGSPEQLRQVRDQFDFLLTMSGPDAHSRIDYLTTIRDNLRRLDLDADD